MKNQRIIDKLWPVGIPHDDNWVRTKVRGKCIQCGRCCALIRLSSDYTYFLEQVQRALLWEKHYGVPGKPKHNLKQMQDYLFIFRNFVPVNRNEAWLRGFRKDVESEDFFYTCEQLTSDGKCRAHDKDKPKVCARFPYYGKKTSEDRRGVSVPLGCGFGNPKRMTYKDEEIKAELK